METPNSHTPCLAIIGLPNVGKSSVLNRFIGRRRAIVDDVAHTTRDSARHAVQLGKRWIMIQDTPGLSDLGDELSLAAMAQLNHAIEEADGVLFVVDAAQEPSNVERKLAAKLHKMGKTVFVIANQIDKGGALAEKYQAFGFSDIFGVSAIHGTGFPELISAIEKHFPGQKQAPPRDVRVAILGRPNVGKSSLTNALAGADIAIVSSQAGTTRDPVTAETSHKDQPWRIIDTAGIRRPGKIERGVEYFSYGRAQEVLDECDICLLVLDATDGSTAQDQRLAGMIEEAGRALIIVVNKIDEIDPLDQGRILLRMQNDYVFMRWAEAIVISAKEHTGLDKLRDAITDLSQRLDQKFTTPELNRVLSDITTKHPPTTTKSFRPKLNSRVQTSQRPLTFVIFGSHPDAVHFSYQRYIENDIRKRYDLRGLPVTVKMASKHREDDRKRRIKEVKKK